MSSRSGGPNYLGLSAKTLRDRSEALFERYQACDLCAHDCVVDRTAGDHGACQVDDTAVVSSAFAHFGEEDCLRGDAGSGTIFLANCNMTCVFCQNVETSHEGIGEPASPRDIADMALALQAEGCHNINFVSPTHHTPHLVEAIRLARGDGLELPVVWNCGGYERPEILELLEGIVDIYMPDVKWADDEAAALYSKAPGYWSNSQASLREMHRQVGDLHIEDGLATDGLLVRHLVMPNQVEGGKRVLEFVADELGRDTFVNLMAQYRPHYKATTETVYSEIGRPITGDEYDALVEHGRALGLTRLQVDRRALAGVR